MRAVRNRKLGKSEKARWDGKRVRRVAGRLLVTQRLLREYVRSKARLERVAGLIDAVLIRDGAEEAGPLFAGFYAETEKRPNWREAFVAARGEAAAARVVARTAPRVFARLRVHAAGDHPSGRLVTATEARVIRKEKKRKRRSA